MFAIALAMLLTASAPSRAECDAACRAKVAPLADEALETARSLSQGLPRDTVLRAVSRNLRWFGFREQGVAAARAMSTDLGPAELSFALKAGQPRDVSLAEGLRPDDPCHSPDWIIAGPGASEGGAATFEGRVESCVLQLDTHWAGPPPRERVDRIYAALPSGATRARLLHWIAIQFQDRETVRWAQAERAKLEMLMPAEERASFGDFMSQPHTLYWSGHRDAALAAARRTDDARQVASLISELVASNDAGTAIDLLPRLAQLRRDFDFGECGDWFGVLGLLANLEASASTAFGRAGLASFIDRLPKSPAFAERCPAGLPDDVAPALLHAAGRTDEAVARAELGGDGYASFLDQVASDAYFAGDVAGARSYWVRAIDALETGSPESASIRKGRRHMSCRLAETLVAVGEIDRATALARGLPNAAWRAIALSAIVSGHRGLTTGANSTRAHIPDVSDLASGG